MTGIIETEKKGVSAFDGIMQLQKIIDVKLKELVNRSGDAYKLVEYLYNRPIVNAQKLDTIIGRTPRTAYILIENLEQINILREITGGERRRLYLFEDYMNLFKNKKIRSDVNQKQ